MKYKLEAFAIISSCLAIGGCIVYSVALLFWHSPAWGVVGCAVLASSGMATHKALGR